MNRSGPPPRRRPVPVVLRIILGLLILMAAGTLLLMLPGVAPVGRHSFMDALFTATSALTVTGLTVLTTSQDFTRLGHLIILILIQVGGVGYVFAASLALRLLGRRVSLSDRMALSHSLGLDTTADIIRVMRNTFYGIILIEGIGALLLYWHWRVNDIVPLDRVFFYAVFHAVSAFCNAGFDLFAGLPEFPEGIPGDNLSLIIMGVLIFMGGLGIPVLSELFSRPWLKRFSLHTRLTLGIVFALILLGWIGLYLPEAREGGVIHDLPLHRQLVRTWFQSISTRTAGFPGFADFHFLAPESQLLVMALMFIGSAPASMGGGITTGTAVVLAMALWSYARGLPAVQVGHRTIAAGTVRRASAVLTISIFIVTLATWLILMTHNFTLNTALFEVISAFATCGLSLGITTALNPFGRLIIILMMFWGRLGAVTIVIAIAQRTSQASHLVKYPEEPLLI